MSRHSAVGGQRSALGDRPDGGSGMSELFDGEIRHAVLIRAELGRGPHLAEMSRRARAPLLIAAIPQASRGRERLRSAGAVGEDLRGVPIPIGRHAATIIRSILAACW